MHVPGGSARRVPGRLVGLTGCVFAVTLGVSSCDGGQLGPEVRASLSIDIEGPSLRVGLAGVPLGDSLIVQLTDGAGQFAPGVPVTWRVVSGGATVITPETVTDARGRAMAMVAPEKGRGEVEASTPGVDPVHFVVEGAAAEAARVYRGRRAYVEYQAGELPLVITVPHGGTVQPTEIPRRAAGNQNRDRQTDLLARAIADSLKVKMGARPHLIISNLHRSRVDPNREIAEAAENHPLGVQAWLEFHGFIAHARERVTDDHEFGLVVDLHGHSHAIARLELGTLVTDAQLRGSDASIDSLAARSSLRALVERTGATLSSFLRGERATGTQFERLGVSAVPSAGQRAPLPGEPFFSGGYITGRWGSRGGGTIDAMQLETYFEGLRDTPENRAAFAGVAARVIQELLVDWYGSPTH